MAFVDTCVTTSMLVKCSVLKLFSGILGLIRSLPCTTLHLGEDWEGDTWHWQDPGSFAMIWTISSQT